MPFLVKGIFYFKVMFMGRVINAVIKEIGLSFWPPFLKDRLFFAALFLALPVWGIVWANLAPTFTVANQSVLLIVFMTVIWYPVLEEVLFRGVIQGSLIKKSIGKKKIIGLTNANWITSIIFVAAHIFYQPVTWALLVIFPSLVYGYFRDRYSSIYPSIVLHMTYNAGFIAINIFAQVSS